MWGFVVTTAHVDGLPPYGHMTKKLKSAVGPKFADKTKEKKSSLVSDNYLICQESFQWRCHITCTVYVGTPQWWWRWHWNIPNSTIPCTGKKVTSQIAKFMGPTWGQHGSCRPQMGPMLAPWILLSGFILKQATAYQIWQFHLPCCLFLSLMAWQTYRQMYGQLEITSPWCDPTQDRCVEVKHILSNIFCEKGYCLLLFTAIYWIESVIHNRTWIGCDIEFRLPTVVDVHDHESPWKPFRYDFFLLCSESMALPHKGGLGWHLWPFFKN